MKSLTKNRDYEKKILQALLTDYKYAEQMMEVIDPDLFDLASCQEISRILINYYVKYQSFPSIDLLKMLISQEINDEIKIQESLKTIEQLQDKPLNGDSQYVKESSLSYFRTQYITDVLKKQVVPKLEDGSNIDEIGPIIQTALQKGIDRDLGLDYKLDDSRFIEEEVSKIPTPWKAVNDALNGGIGQGRLVTILGGSGCGKSFWTINLGYSALMAGKKVVHYTLELDKVDVGRRYDARFCNVKINDVPLNKEKIKENLTTLMPNGAELIIKEYPMVSVSIQHIKSHLIRLKLRNVDPDLIIIDYGDLLLPSFSSRDGHRHNLRAVWQEMKSLAQELKIPVVTPSQVNRVGSQSEIITPDQVSEDFSKIMTSDIIITAARNMEQKRIGIGKMYLAKNRQGKDGQIMDYSIDTDYSRIEILELSEEEKEDLKEAIQNRRIKEDINEIQNYVMKQRKETYAQDS